jgi:hypothetical protein
MKNGNNASTSAMLRNMGGTLDVGGRIVTDLVAASEMVSCKV